MVCWASGGQQKYTGKPMADSHAHLKITGQEWEAFLGDFQQTLDKFKVPAEEQAELRAIVDSTRSDIVIDSALRAASERLRSSRSEEFSRSSRPCMPKNRQQ